MLDLATAVKELVENSLDASATRIDVRLKDYGLENIEVSDNGEGIAESNYAVRPAAAVAPMPRPPSRPVAVSADSYGGVAGRSQALALRHHTSKLAAFSDLELLDTFGFRGEALSALAALGQLTVLSRQRDQKCAARLEYAAGGTLSKQTPVAREVGTTVTVARLFQALPVRHAEFKRNFKKEFSKLQVCVASFVAAAPALRRHFRRRILTPRHSGRALQDVLSGYALVARGVRLTVTNVTTQGSKQNVLTSSGNGLLKDTIAKVLGIKQLQVRVARAAGSPFQWKHADPALVCSFFSEGRPADPRGGRGGQPDH